MELRYAQLRIEELANAAGVDCTYTSEWLSARNGFGRFDPYPVTIRQLSDHGLVIKRARADKSPLILDALERPCCNPRCEGSLQVVRLADPCGWMVCSSRLQVRCGRLPAENYRVLFPCPVSKEISMIVSPTQFPIGKPGEMELIYALCSNENPGKIRYVGKTPHMASRFHKHIRGSSSSPHAVFEWIRGELLNDKMPYPLCLEIVRRDYRGHRSKTVSDVYAAEKRWIKKLLAEGAELLNVMHAQ